MVSSAVYITILLYTIRKLANKQPIRNIILGDWIKIEIIVNNPMLYNKAIT